MQQASHWELSGTASAEHCTWAFRQRVSTAVQPAPRPPTALPPPHSGALGRRAVCHVDAPVNAHVHTSQFVKQVPLLCSGQRAVDGTLVLNGNADQALDWQVVDLLGSPASSVTMSFEQLFKVYRGPRFTDELEALGSAAASSCNRLRSRMSGAAPTALPAR